MVLIKRDKKSHIQGKRMLFPKKYSEKNNNRIHTLTYKKLKTIFEYLDIRKC